MDQMDINIIKQLQKDGRISITNLSKKVALSRPSVKERVERLEDMGIIEGYTALVPFSAVGRSLLVMIELSDLRTSIEDFENMIVEEPDVLECHQATGHVHYYIKAAFNGIDDLTKLVEKLINYGNTKTSIILDTILDRQVILPTQK